MHILLKGELPVWWRSTCITISHACIVGIFTTRLRRLFVCGPRRTKNNSSCAAFRCAMARERDRAPQIRTTACGTIIYEFHITRLDQFAKGLVYSRNDTFLISYRSPSTADCKCWPGLWKHCVYHTSTEPDQKVTDKTSAPAKESPAKCLHCTSNRCGF